MNGKREKFIRAFANVPEPLRKDILVVVNKRPFTWDTAYLEVKDNTSIGKKILKTLEEMDIL